MKKLIYIVCLCLNFSGLIYCSDILPKFMGYYTNSDLTENQYFKKINLSELSGKNTCVINEYIDKRVDYRNKIDSNYESLVIYASSFDPSHLFEGNPGHYKKCVFNKLEKATPFFFMEYPGSLYEVYTSLNDTPIYDAYYSCYRDDISVPYPQPDPYPETRSVRIVPIYQCPEGYTSFSYNDGCIKNEKLLCPGDVLGRDLNLNDFYPPFIKKQGHVGMAVFHIAPYEEDFDIENRGIKVAEMLGQDDAGLHISLFSDFKEKVKDGYWGAKYGATEKSQPMSMIQYNSLTKLLNYILEDDVKYTWSWSYSIRHVKKSYLYNPYLNEPVVTKWYFPSVFRCDTFVKYMYEKGAGIQLNLNKFFSPKDLFEHLIFKREKVNFVDDNSLFIDACTGGFSELKDNIKTMIHPSSYQELYKLDLCMQSFVEYDTNEQDKVQFLWNLYNNEGDLFSKKYLLDNLVKFKTLTETKAIIDSFADGYYFYDELYELLFENIRFDSESDIYKLSSADIENIKKIYDFLGLTQDDFPEKISNFKSMDRNLIKKKSILKNHLNTYGV